MSALRRARRAHGIGLSRRALSELSTVSEATIKELEAGTSPGSERSWLRLSRALNLPPEQLRGA